jgi:glycosidase
MPVEDWTSTVGITRNWQYLGDLQPHMLNFLENHDEQRFCSDFFGKSTSNALAPLYVSLLLNTAPYMIYFGEEVGEKGMDHEGFSGRDGRTTIFDWWSVDSVRRLRKVIKSGAYKSSKVNELISAGMNREEAEFFVRFNKVTRYASEDESIKEGMTYDLCYCNYDSEGFDKDRHFAFLRYFKGHPVLVAANFSRTDAKMHVTIPHHAFEWMQIPVTPTRYPGMSITVEIPAADAVTITLI